MARLPLPRDTLLTLACSPLLALQAVWVVARATRLPEPPGARQGQTGVGPDLRLLVLGDSSAAGVGASSQSEALAPQLADALGTTQSVSWRLCARNGATSADAPNLLTPLKHETFDAAMIVFGVNDVKNLRTEQAWRRDMTSLTNLLRRRHGITKIFLSGLPPMGDFPLLPNPMRHILGLRAARFDAALRDVAKAQGAVHLSIDLPLDPAGVASDGFHPGPPIYAHWAREAAKRMRPHL